MITGKTLTKRKEGRLHYNLDFTEIGFEFQRDRNF